MATKNLYILFIIAIAVTLTAVSIAPPVHAATDLQAKLAVRPVTTGDISAYKLPATTQKSAGMLTVGLGQPLYLEVQVNKAIAPSDISGITWDLRYKPGASNATITDSPLGTSVPIYEPSDRLVAQIAGRAMLIPDAEGYYVVAARITLASGETADVAQTFLGGKYVGAATCTLCHNGLLPDKVTPWSNTGHATMLKEGIDGKLGHYSESCISCHTVGYDANAKVPNGGFNDVAKQNKWTFPATLQAGNWDAMPYALQNVSNIQCENCHGPGSVHVTGAFDLGLNVSSGSGVCGQCHDAPTHHIKTAEWNNSRHAVVTRDPSGAGREGCVGCHTGTGFIGKTSGMKTLDTAYNPVNCQTCHEPHGQTTPGNNAHLVRLQQVVLADGTHVADAGAGTLCMNCHQSRQKASVYAATAPASTRFGPHHGPQADMLEGVNGFTYGQTIESSKHASVPDTCVTCHMQAVDATSPVFLKAGGHTFMPNWEGDGTNPGVDLVAACQKCHGPEMTSFDVAKEDYDGDGKIDTVQTEVQHLLDKLSALLPPVGEAKTSLKIDSSWTRPQLEGAYNWQFVAEDKSKGVHNTKYAVGLLKASIADLTKK